MAITVGSAVAQALAALAIAVLTWSLWRIEKARDVPQLYVRRISSQGSGTSIGYEMTVVNSGRHATAIDDVTVLRDGEDPVKLAVSRRHRSASFPESDTLIRPGDAVVLWLGGASGLPARFYIRPVLGPPLTCDGDADGSVTER